MSGRIVSSQTLTFVNRNFGKPIPLSFFHNNVKKTGTKNKEFPETRPEKKHKCKNHSVFIKNRGEYAILKCTLCGECYIEN